MEDEKTLLKDFIKQKIFKWNVEEINKNESTKAPQDSLLCSIDNEIIQPGQTLVNNDQPTTQFVERSYFDNAFANLVTQIRQSNTELRNDLKSEIKQSNNELRNELKSELAEIKNTVGDLSTNQQVMLSDIRNLKTDVKHLTCRVDNLEKDRKGGSTRINARKSQHRGAAFKGNATKSMGFKQLSHTNSLPTHLSGNSDSDSVKLSSAESYSEYSMSNEDQPRHYRQGRHTKKHTYTHAPSMSEGKHHTDTHQYDEQTSLNKLDDPTQKSEYCETWDDPKQDPWYLKIMALMQEYPGPVENIIPATTEHKPTLIGTQTQPPPQPYNTSRGGHLVFKNIVKNMITPNHGVD
jgi:polyhydroxyalkanoate synthesis regulator phasin